ncbi:MAG: hypothetical protein JEY99_20985 [Spirochaetales bacterium]|nr:hypothetical protein [Spirochaetales bacterium]
MICKRVRSYSLFPLFFLVISLLIYFTGCQTSSKSGEGETFVDGVTSASGNYYYEANSYSLKELKEVLSLYPYPAATAVSTVNLDGSPNLAVTIPGFSKQGDYLILGLAENRTRENILRDGRGVIIFYDYTPGAVKEDRNKGCRVIVRWVGPQLNDELNTRDELEKPALYLMIEDLLPLG